MKTSAGNNFEVLHSFLKIIAFSWGNFRVSYFVFGVFSGPHLRLMEVPRLGVKLEPQPPTSATAMPDPTLDPSPTERGQGSNPSPCGFQLGLLLPSHNRTLKFSCLILSKGGWVSATCGLFHLVPVPSTLDSSRSSSITYFRRGKQVLSPATLWWNSVMFTFLKAKSVLLRILPFVD